MKNIKFRAWDNEDKKMLKQTSTMSFNETGDKEKSGYNWEAYTRNMIEVMQFTGLTDTNDVQIYEGDIVSVPYVTPYGGIAEDTEQGKYSILFEFGQFVINTPYSSTPLSSWCNRSESTYIPNYGKKVILQTGTLVTVVGNIYENPELLN